MSRVPDIKRYKYIVGIDPDVDASGVGIYSCEEKRLIEVDTCAFAPLCERLRNAFNHDREDVLMLVEAGWINAKANYHGVNGYAGQRVAKNVGSNQQIGKCLIEVAQFHGLRVEPVRPLRKYWKGSNNKITAEEFKAVTGWSRRSSQDARDAALIAWGYRDVVWRH